MTDYQRACEIVGCNRSSSPETFEYYASRFLTPKLFGYQVYQSSIGRYHIMRTSLTLGSGDTLTEALTQAVLAVAGETE